jgi:hypothetical protein
MTPEEEKTMDEFGAALAQGLYDNLGELQGRFNAAATPADLEALKPRFMHFGTDYLTSQWELDAATATEFLEGAWEVMKAERWRKPS